MKVEVEIERESWWWNETEEGNDIDKGIRPFANFWMTQRLEWKEFSQGEGKRVMEI